MATNYKAPGNVLQYTCGASETVSSGDVLFVNGIPGVAIHSIGNSAKGSIAISGVWEVDKHNNATHGADFKLGAPVYWDAGTKKAVVAAGNFQIGFAYESADKDATTVKVLLSGDPKDAPVPFLAGEALTGGKLLLYISGYDADKSIVKMSKAAKDGAPAQFYLPVAVSDATLGVAYRNYHQKAIDTDTLYSAVGDVVYLGAAGAHAQAGTTTNREINQVVGVVTAYDDTDGAILYNLADSKALTYSVG